MKTGAAVAVVVALIALTAISLLASAWVLAVLALAALVLMRKGRGTFLAFAATTILLNTLIVALFLPGEPSWTFGPIALGQSGALAGFVGGLRLASLLGCNLAVLAWFPPSAVLDGLRLPPRALALMAATMIAAHDVGRDWRRIIDARRLEAAWPRGLLRRIPAAAAILPVLVVASLRRAATRRDALQLAGQPVGPSFSPIVAIAALAVAGRLALLALPNIALTYVVVFVGGLLFGTRVAVSAALLSMVLTDLLLTGFLPVAFANAPAMAAVGAMGGLLRRFDFVGGTRQDRAAGAILASVCGIVATLLFSGLSDLITWLLVPEYALDVGVLRGLLLAGFAFNVIPAAVNGALFAAAVGPVTRAIAVMDPRLRFQGTRKIP